MSRSSFFTAGISAVFLTTLSLSARADDPTDVIEYRKHIMRTLGEQSAALGMIMQKKAPDDNFAVHAELLAATAASALKAFEPKVVGGDAKPQVWDKWDDFSKRMKELAANTTDLAVSAKAGGTAAAGPKMQGALTCKGCHDIYRAEKK